MNVNEVRSTAKRGNTNLNNVTITMIRDTAQNGNGQSTWWRNFAIRKDNNYIDQVQNSVIEKQPLDLFCTTWDLEVIKALDHVKEGDRVNISAFLEPIWRGYKANNTLNGIRFIVPETGQAPVQLPDGDVIQPEAHPYRLDKGVRNAIIYQGVTLNVVSLIPATTIKTELTDSTTSIRQHIRNLETVWCHLHLRSQPRYPRFTLCPECRVEAPYETPIVEAVVNYFSKPQFQEFFIETEREIQMGTYNRRSDIVLLDKSTGFVAIAECKQTGVVTYGREQLESYLCATDTQFGVFANSTNPDEWEFYENLRRNKFTPSMERFLFERKVTTERSIESIREEKNKLDQEIQKASDQHAQKTREVDSSCKQLDELNKRIERKNKELTQIKEEIDPLRKESSDLKEENARLKKRARIVVSRESRLDELEAVFDQKKAAFDHEKAAFAKESIYGQLQKEFERLEKLESEIARKQQLARQDQEKHAAYERNRVEINQKEQQLAQVSQERESTLKQLRVVVNQLKTANSEQKSQIEKKRRQLVQDLQEPKRKSIHAQLTEEIEKCKKEKSELEKEIMQEMQQLPFEERKERPTYVQIQAEIDKLKTEKSKIEAKIGHQIFLRLP